MNHLEKIHEKTDSPYAEFEHGNIKRETVLGAVIALKESGVKDASDMEDPRIQAISKLFESWYWQEEEYISGEGNEEANLRFMLLQDRIPFDAEWITDPKKLAEIDKELDVRLEQAEKEFDFSKLAGEIRKYKEDIEQKLKRKG